MNSHNSDYIIGNLAHHMAVESVLYDRMSDAAWEAFLLGCISLKDTDPWNPAHRALFITCKYHWDKLAHPAVKDILNSIEKEVAKGRKITPTMVRKELQKFEDMAGIAFPPATRDDIETTIAAAYMTGRKGILSPLKMEPTFNLKDREAIQWLQKDAKFWIGTYYDRQLGESISKTVQTEIFDKQLSNRDAADKLKEILGGTFKKSDTYWLGLAGTVSTRAQTFGTINSMVQAGAISYEWNANPDERLCPVCGQLDGNTFSVDSARQHMEDFMFIQNPMVIKDKYPWPSVNPRDLENSKDLNEIKDLLNSDPNKLNIKGWGVPPIHFFCRCRLIVDSFTDVTLPTDILPDPNITKPPRPQKPKPTEVQPKPTEVIPEKPKPEPKPVTSQDGLFDEYGRPIGEENYPLKPIETVPNISRMESQNREMNLLRQYEESLAMELREALIAVKDGRLLWKKYMKQGDKLKITPEEAKFLKGAKVLINRTKYYESFRPEDIEMLFLGQMESLGIVGISANTWNERPKITVGTMNVRSHISDAKWKEIRETYSIPEKEFSEYAKNTYIKEMAQYRKDINHGTAQSFGYLRQRYGIDVTYSYKDNELLKPKFRKCIPLNPKKLTPIENLLNHEREIVLEPVEHLIMYKHGKFVARTTSNNTSMVELSNEMRKKGLAGSWTTHNHPSQGGSFSVQDIRAHIWKKNELERAVGLTFNVKKRMWELEVHSLEKGVMVHMSKKKFDIIKFIEKRHDELRKEGFEAINMKFRTGKLKDYGLEFRKVYHEMWEEITKNVAQKYNIQLEYTRQVFAY